MAFTIGRLAVGDPESWTEQLGDPVTNQGGAAVPGVRTPLRQTAPPFTFAPDGSSDLLADRQRIRRQLRSMLNNTPCKLAGLYVAWDADTEQNGIYLPDQAQLAAAGDAPLAHGMFKVDGLQWVLQARPRTHRRGTAVYLKDRRVSSWWRDYYRTIYSTDFSGLTALALTYLPAGVSDVIDAVTGAFVTANALPGTTADGGTLYFALALSDLAVMSFEQSEANRNLGDVVVRDRRGTITAPAGGPDTAWEEVYGPDYPVSSADVPVLENGRVRVRYDSTNTPGFRIDVWTGAAWTEQGKVLLQRRGDSNAFLDTLVSTTVLEWTPERSVIQVVMRVAADAVSRDRVIITLQRGWSGPRFEAYPAPKAAGTAAGAQITFIANGADTNDSVLKIDASNAAVAAATAGTGSSAFGPVTILGAATFTGENETVMLRQGAGQYSAALAVLQAAAGAAVASGTEAYGATRNRVGIFADSTGYVSAHLGFHAQQADQVMEAESMTAGAGTTSPVVDAAASNGNSTTSTRTADAIHVSKATWPNSAKGKYRVFARVKTTASTLNIYAKTGATTGATKTTTSASFVWIDLGDITADAGTLEIHAWATAAATISVDRIEAFKLEDRTATAPAYDGARDLGQAVLYDSRSPQRWVTR